jgi:hypothetical protein
MKISRLGSTVLTGRPTQVVLATTMMLLVFCLVSISSAAAKEPNLCKEISQDLQKSCKASTSSAYSLAKAKCDNLPTSEERKTCDQQAKADKKARGEECKAQFDARQEVCNGLGQSPYNPIINPADFVATIDNPYFPLTPGTTYIYEGITERGLEHVETTVTTDTKVILGVTCNVVRDTVTVDGVLAEDTFDWYAQDKTGNVCYFGENSLSYEGGLIVSLAGSWIAGVDGAKPGIIMEASPKVGDLYRQEFSAGVAEDMAEVLSLNESVTVPAGSYTNCIKTKDLSPIEPDAIKHKLYCPGVGNVQIVDLETGNHTDLLAIIK